MKNITVILIFLLSTNILFAKGKKYPVSDIPEELLEHANMVVRESQTILNLKSINNATCSYHYAYTILNKAAENYLPLVLFYNNRIKVNNITYVVYDKDGNEIDKVKKADIEDYSAVGGNMFSDSRVKAVKPGEYDYPITIDCSFDYTYNGFLSYPDFSPIPDYNVSVMSALFQVTVDTDATFRFKEYNTDGLTKDINEANRIYQWKANNVAAIEYEALHDDLFHFAPTVLTAPTKFKIEGNKGDLSSWKDFGLWIKDLNKGRDELSEETIEKVKAMTANAKSDIEKAEILYKYMQNNSRYVSIQLGIGSWQPMPAKDVDRLAYGDCKALSNYMKALLKVVGVKSNYALVYGGRSPESIVADFPSIQFNHIILCVPFESDTIWLENTNQNIPFGFLGSFTDNRHALLITPDGGKLVKTKTYSITDNQTISKATVKLNPAANSSAVVNVDYKGINYDYMRGLLVGDDDDKKKQMYSRIDLPGFTINSFSHTVDEDIIPIVHENIDMQLKNFCTNMGNRSFFNPNLLSRKKNDLQSCDNRISDIKLAHSFSNIDTITYIVPDGYRLAGLKDPIVIKSDFGIYRAEFVEKDGNLIYIRKREIYEGIYPKEKYLDLVDYYNQIIKADNTKLAIVKE